MEIIVLIIACSFVLLCFFYIVSFLNKEKEKKNSVLRTLDEKFEIMENNNDVR
jgi:hypothetical protein